MLKTRLAEKGARSKESDMKLKAKPFKAEEKDNKPPSVVLTTIKGSMLSVAASLILVLLFAFALKYIAIPVTAIRPVNQAIKGISVFIGVFLALRRVKQMGFVHGMLIGLAYTALAFVVFSILDGGFVFSRTLVNDLLFSGIIGAICGILAVNVLGRKD